jgi:hypothetical protein
MGMWVRSYLYGDIINGKLCSTQGFGINSEQGRVALAWVTSSIRLGPLSWNYRAIRLSTWLAMTKDFEPEPFSPPHSFGFKSNFWPDWWRVVVPYWFLVTSCGTLALILRMRWPPWRFTLRSLFTSTTFLAVVLGMIAWLDRAWIGK